MTVDQWGKRISGEDPEPSAAEKVKREAEDAMKGEDGEAVQAQRSLSWDGFPARDALTDQILPQGGPMPPVVRQFASGANRDVDTGKFDYEAFISPLVEERYAAYMHQNRFLKDGTMRDGDNWQKGIPIPVYRKSLERHVKQVKKVSRGWASHDTIEADLCAVIFNASGMLHELLKRKQDAPAPAGPFGPFGEVK